MNPLNLLTIKEAISGLEKGEFSSVNLVNACFDYIDKYDSKINAFITLTKTQAVKDALSADNEIKKLGRDAFEKKPLLGIPYACKDNFSTKGIKTTASSNVLKDYISPYESTVTSRLKKAGAILLGKTNMDAFAHGSSTESSDFFTTRNPWNLSKLPGGSSGGSAAAVASNMCIFAIGSETAGSIRGPASWCGVTGLKPTYGRVSRYGLIAMASSTDSPGPITKTVEDGAIVLKVVAGKDKFDATTSDKRKDNYEKKLWDVSLKGLRIGKPKSYFEINMEPGMEKGVREKVEESVDVFKSMGAEIVDMDLLDPKYSIAVYTILQRSEVSSNLARLDGIRYGRDRTFFGFEAKKRMMLGAYALSAGYYDQYYSKAQKVRTLIVEDFGKAFKNVDLIIAPTFPCVALEVGASEKSFMFGELMDILQEPSSIAGLPGVTIPCGFSDGLPVGVQLIGRHFDERMLLGVAHKYQEITTFHKQMPDLSKL